LSPHGAPLSRRTACPLDCPDACALEVTVDPAAGRLRGLARADASDPGSLGFLCGKVARIGAYVHGRERLTAPLMRAGAKGSGAFREAGWDEALDRVAAEFAAIRDRHGGEAILPVSYGGSNGALSQGVLDERFFRRLGASRLLRTVCAAANGRAASALYGSMPGVPFEHYPAARLIVIWGCNPHATGIHLVPRVREALRRGARVVVVDPRRTGFARDAALHLPVRPGGDLVLALAVVRELVRRGAHDRAFLDRHAQGFERLLERAEPWDLERAASRTGLSVSGIEAFVTLYASTSPAVIRLGWGVERSRDGGAASAAILALPAVAGKFGVEGGGYTLSNSALWPLDREPAVQCPAPPVRAVNMNRLGRALAESVPPIRALFAYNCNPLAVLPRQDLVRRGLEREDLFTVVHEQVMTDTARYADVVLPATTFLEHGDLPRGYGERVMHRTRPVVPAVGEAWSNHRLFGALIRRMGLHREGDVEDEDALVELLVARLEPRVRAELGATGRVRDRGAGVQMRDVWPGTPDRRIALFPEALEREVPHGLYVPRPDPGEDATGRALDPLALITPARADQISSTFGGRRARKVALRLHPEDAAARGLEDGARVRVFNEHGSVEVLLALDARLRPGVAELPKGMWDRDALGGGTANTLCPDDLADLGGGACFNDARVEVEAV
jgi:anaerobic selenocysteine-containing dehydrogenase